MTVRDLFVYLEATQIVYFETIRGVYIIHGPIARIWKKYADCPVHMIHCKNPYCSLFVTIRNPEGKQIFETRGEGIWS